MYLWVCVCVCFVGRVWIMSLNHPLTSLCWPTLSSYRGKPISLMRFFKCVSALQKRCDSYPHKCIIFMLNWWAEILQNTDHLRKLLLSSMHHPRHLHESILTVPTHMLNLIFTQIHQWINAVIPVKAHQSTMALCPFSDNCWANTETNTNSALLAALHGSKCAKFLSPSATQPQVTHKLSQSTLLKIC